MNKNDRMTPMERLNGFLTGGEMDRLLTMPLICSMSGKCAGMTHREKRSTAENEAKCQISAYERFGNDLLIVEYGLHGVGKALGSVMNDPEDSVPAVIDHVLKSIDDFDNLDWSRASLANDPSFQQHLDCAKILIEKMGSEVPTGVLVSGPFTAAASIYPTEKLLKATVRNSEFVAKLMRKCTDVLMEVHNEFVKAGAMILLCEPIATGSIISDKVFLNFVLPYLQEITDNVHAHGGMVCLHICGDTKKVLPLMVKAGADMISIDNRVELEFGKSIIEKTVPLIGNVDPVDSMILGTPKDVENAVKKCIQIGHDAQHGYILSTGCDLNGAVPLENLDAFMAAARKYGKLPIDSNL